MEANAFHKILYIPIHSSLIQFHIQDLLVQDVRTIQSKNLLLSTMDRPTEQRYPFVERCVCSMFVLSCSVVSCRVLLCSIVYYLRLLLSLYGRPVGRCGDRGYYVH